MLGRFLAPWAIPAQGQAACAQTRFRSDESAAVHKAAKHAAQVPALSNGLRLHRSLSLRGTTPRRQKTVLEGSL